MTCGFYRSRRKLLSCKEPTRIVHAFEITQKLDLIVLQAIARILGIALGKKKTHNTVVTTNSRSISNIIDGGGASAAALFKYYEGY